MSVYDSMLVATDGSPASRAAVTHAIALAEHHDATLYVLTVVDPSHDTFRFGVEQVDALNRHVNDLQADIIAAHATADCAIVPRVRRGTPTTVILDVAEEVEADVIVLGNQGHAGLAAALLGGTTDRVIRLATVPVIVVGAD